MNKKKLFSVVSSSILAFSAGAPSVLAGAPLVEDVLSQESGMNQDSISLLDIVNVESEEIKDFLSGFYINKSESEEIRLFGNSSTYTLHFTIDKEENNTIEEAKEFSLLLPQIKTDSAQFLSIEIVSGEERIGLVEVAFKDISQALEDIERTADTITTKNEMTEIPVETSEELNESEIIEEPALESTGEKLSEHPVEEAAEKETVDNSSEEINDQIENADENQTESVERNVSFERASDIEILLHGEDVMSHIDEPVSMMRSMLTISSTRTHDDGIYTVKSGDYFNSIASSFNLSTAQLKYWNTHVSDINVLKVGTQLAVTRRGVERMLSSTDKSRLYTGGATSVFASNKEFIDEIAPRAIAVANQDGEEGLWPSLMIAQAAHESAFGRSSLSSPPYHNLSGIKGSYNGKSVLMWTWEVFEGSRVDILDGFKHYPSYNESLQDYANLMRRGISWSRDYYSGTWRSNSDSVWDVLENKGLRGYATDPNYYIKIGNTIDAYNLTQYDNLKLEDVKPEVIENVSNSKSVSYSGLLLSGYSIDTLPWGMKGFQRVGLTREYSNQLVKVVKESQNGAYLLIELNGKLLGWVDHKSVRSEARRLSDAVNISYDVIVQDGWYSIDSLPWGTPGYDRIGNTTQFKGETLKVIQETKNGNYQLLEKNGQLIGWVDHRSVSRAIEVKNVSNSFPVDYNATIKSGGFSLDSLPWGTAGYQRVDWTTKFVGKQVQVTHESGAYALVTVNGTPLGWVDKRALDGVPVRQNYSVASSVNYSAQFKSGYTIDTLPWGVSGHRRISRTQYYSGQYVRVVKQTGSYALIQINGRNLGWVDRRALNK